MTDFGCTQNQGKAFRLRQAISDRGHRKEPRAVIGDPSVAEVLRWRWMTWRNYRPTTNRKGGEMHAELEWSRLHVLCCPCSRSSWRACVSHGADWSCPTTVVSNSRWSCCDMNELPAEHQHAAASTPQTLSEVRIKCNQMLQFMWVSLMYVAVRVCVWIIRNMHSEYDHNYTYVCLSSRTFECIMYLNVLQNATFNNCFILFHSLYTYSTTV